MAFAWLSSQANARSNCGPADSAQKDVIEAVKTMFDAARADDMSKFDSVVAPDFYAYDAARQFVGPALMNFLKQAHQSGKKFEWSVTEPNVHVSCDMAWITYVNRGAVEDSTGRQEVTWLESAVLHYRNRHWWIQFLHSTRAAAPP